MNKKIQTWILLLLGVIAMAFALIACGDNSTISVDETPSITKDAAESIASNIAYDTGGTIDQIMDLNTFATAGGFDTLKEKYPVTHFIFDKTYDPVEGKWSIHIERERGTSGLIPYAFVSRDYILQFLDGDGEAQQYYITDADTARTVNFQVVQGYGRHLTRRLSQQLNQLNANWILTNAHQDIVTINGTYYRAAVDTIRTFLRVRTSDHNLQLNIENLTMPRGQAPSVIGAISGSITGHFHADITFTSGSSYSESVIDRDINILIGSGQAEIGINNQSYLSNLTTGELLE